MSRRVLSVVNYIERRVWKVLYATSYRSLIYSAICSLLIYFGLGRRSREYDASPHSD
jgi:hypothetical protein